MEQLREYAKSLVAGWIGKAFVVSLAVVGGVPGALFLLEWLSMSALDALTLTVLALSLVFNVRQYFVWKQAIWLRESAERSAEVSELQADFFRLEEESWWTSEGLRVVENRNLGPRRMGASPMRVIEVTSDFEIRPLRLRYWFGCEIREVPVVQLISKAPAGSEESGTVIEPSGQSPATVYSEGRVDIFWLEDSASLGPGVALRIYVWPKEKEDAIDLRSVQRRWRVY